MPTASVNRYTAQRAELLANLVLTRRKDVRVLSLPDRDDAGIDLLAHIIIPVKDLPASPYLGVQVNGTSNPLEDERAANRLGNRIAQSMATRAFILAPVVLLVFSMEGDRGYWGWLVEPSVGGPKRPALTRPVQMAMERIDADSMDAMFSRVVEWFEAMSAVLRTNQVAS